MKIKCITRAPRFSPNSVEKDKAIMQAVASFLREQGHQVTMASENDLENIETLDSIEDQPDVILTMSRSKGALQRLSQSKVLVINNTHSIEICSDRSQIAALMLLTGSPIPPSMGSEGYWIKRSDATAQSPDDVVYAADDKALEEVLHKFDERGIGRREVQAHVIGDLVKFYAVRGTDFFRYYYPTDDGNTKFGDEQHNGTAHHYKFDEQAMKSTVNRLAEAVGIDIYGGDCIVRADGSFCIIDFNDWPSFSRCREEAAQAIAERVMRLSIKV